MAAKKRKHNSAAERAHQKNVERAKLRAQKEKRKAFWEKYRKLFIFGIPAAAVLIIGIWLVCKATIGPGGSIPNFFGHLQGVQQDWIVTNQGTSSSPRYYKMGAFTVPEGYTLDPDYSIVSDKLAQNFYCTADDAGAAVHSVYVSGIQNKSAADMIDTVLGFNLYYDNSGKQEGVIGGQNGLWLIGRINDDENTGEETGEAPEMKTGHIQMVFYVDSVQNGCVLVSMNSASSTPAGEIPSEETFLAEAEKIVSCLNIEK